MYIKLKLHLKDLQMVWNSCTFFPSPLSSPLSEPVGVSGRLGGGLVVWSSFVGGTTMHCTSWRISAVTIWMDWPLESLRDCVCVGREEWEESRGENVLCSHILRPLKRTRLGERRKSKQGGWRQKKKAIQCISHSVQCSHTWNSWGFSWWLAVGQGRQKCLPKSTLYASRTERKSEREADR